MQAVIVTKYGSPDVLRIREVEKPEPKPNEVLVKIQATVAAPPDCAFRKGDPAISRLFSGLAKPRYIPGDVFAGIIEKVGEDVKLFHAGDAVYGSSGALFGTNAGYIALPENAAIAGMPANVTYEEAAAISEGSLTALPFLRDSGQVRKGFKVLINGASGGVGVYAVQLAKYFGADVTAVCSGGNAEMVLSLGAESVIDYAKEDFTGLGDAYDIIFDAVGKSSFLKCRKALRSGGKYMSTVPTPGIMAGMLWTSVFGNKKALFSATGLRKPEEKKRDLVFIKELVETGSLKPVIDRTYPLEQISEAHRYVETGHKKGSVAVSVRH
jgi:NADPH:quinone reductase-like Zn-dependent oxidoreductase